jgi:hypothetical protein
MTTRATVTGRTSFPVKKANSDSVFRFKIDIIGASDGLNWDYHQTAGISIVCIDSLLTHIVF